jgi:hypothetical protein
MEESVKHKLENTDETLVNVHPATRCKNERCTIHNMSDHHMREWPQHWRDDRGIMERICPHGVGHPDPDNPWELGDLNWIHGCDGCCDSDKNLLDMNQDLVDDLIGMAEIVEGSQGVASVVMLSGDIFREAAQVISDLTEECKIWEQNAMRAFELLAGEPFEPSFGSSFEETLDAYKQGIDWIWPPNKSIQT